MKKLSTAVVYLGVQSFWIRSGDFEEIIETDREPFSLIEICIAIENSNPRMEDFQLIKEFEIPVINGFIFIEGAWSDDEDVVLEANDNNINIRVYKNESNEYLVLIPESVSLYKEEFVCHLENKHILMSINHESNKTFHSLEFKFKDTDWEEDGKEVIQLVPEFFHANQEVDIPNGATHYHVDKFDSITFEGFYSEDIERLPMKKVIYPTIDTKSVDIYHTEDELIVLIK